MAQLNILVLHRLGNPRLVPDFLYRHVFSLRNHEPEHQYIFHDTQLPLPDYVINQEFDAIILDVTLLCVRWYKKEVFDQIRKDYSFIKNSKAVKIAFPQDEYDCSAILDEWMVDWKIDIVFSVISGNWNVLYPRFSKVGCILLGYTGYINEELLNIPKIPFLERPIDIGYRARKLPPYFGQIGEEKWKIGEIVLNLSKKYALNVDIALGEIYSLHGKKWLDFIRNSKFTLGANSGSSLLDPYGYIQHHVREYLNSNPNASFKEVEEKCFKGLDGNYTFTAISPRVLEAGLLESGQILLEGSYSNLISPWHHYIPIKKNGSNFDDVVMAMRDVSFVMRMIKNCRETLLDSKELRAKHQTSRVIDLIYQLKEEKNIKINSLQIKNVIFQYENDVTPKLKIMWQRQENREKLSKFINKHKVLVLVKNMMRKGLRTLNVL